MPRLVADRSVLRTCNTLSGIKKRVIMTEKNDEPLLATDLSELLHRRVIDNCALLYRNGHFPQAALEAMKQVELALREKTLAPKKFFGRRLIKRTFKEERGIKLTVPLGPEYQEAASSLFEGAFGYYRNYTAHEGEKIDKLLCARVLILASELLDLLAASEKTLPSAGGVEGLVEYGFSKSHKDFGRCLEFYKTGHWIPDETFDGYLEDLASHGISQEQEQLMFELGLVECRSEVSGTPDVDLIDIIELTPLGKSLLGEITDGEDSPSTGIKRS